MHGLYSLTVNLAGERPLAMTVDDLHRSDAASLRFLGYLVRRLEGLPILVVCTLRPFERTDSAAFDEIRADPLSVSLHPRPLSTDAAARLLNDRLGEQADEAFAAACHSTTGGTRCCSMSSGRSRWNASDPTPPTTPNSPGSAPSTTPLRLHAAIG